MTREEQATNAAIRKIPVELDRIATALERIYKALGAIHAEISNRY